MTTKFKVGDNVHDWDMHNNENAGLRGTITKVTGNKIHVQYHRDFLVFYKKSEFKFLSKD